MQRRSPIALVLILFLVSATVDGEPAGPSQSAEIISHIKREAVESTAIASIGYSKRLHALEIEFRNGAIYRYLEVEPSVHLDLINAKSKARFYDENIRKKYRSLHVRPRAE